MKDTTGRPEALESVNAHLLGSDCLYGFKCYTMPEYLFPNETIIGSNSLNNKIYNES